MSTFRVHYFQHIKDEGLASPEFWLEQRQAIVTATEFFNLAQGDADITLPLHDDVDLLIIMGGAMSVNDEDVYPWLVAEKQWIRHFIALNKPVVGLCLGAQLIACSLGAVVTKNPLTEIGWWPIQKKTTSAPEATTFQFPQTLTALSWHGDTFDLPNRAILLAENGACAHQAFQYGDRVLGFQFHPEITPQNLQLFLSDNSYDEMTIDMTNNKYIQSSDQIASVNKEQFYQANQLLDRALDYVMRSLQD
jgi:GMP synthase-like glutamine amidotransferase